MTTFIDTAVIMYAGGTDHPLRAPCQALLARVAAGDLNAVTSVAVVQEILHRFGTPNRRGIGAAMASHTLDLFAPLIALTDTTMRRMPELFTEYPQLPARDLVHVATCFEAGIQAIVSPDRGFDAVEGLRRVDPAHPDL